MMLYRPDLSKTTSMFFLYALMSSKVQSNILKQIGGSTVGHAKVNEIRMLEVPLPPLPEQRSIAQALSDVDALIAALDQLIAKKRHLKTATMQQLLTGKKRLPGFGEGKGYQQSSIGLIPEDWEVSTVGNEFSIQLGKMIDAEKNVGIQKPYLGNRAIQWGYIETNEIGLVPLTLSDIKRFRLEKGDLLVCEGGEVGRAAIWNDQLEECYYQKALHRLRPIQGYNVYLMTFFLQHWASTGVLTDFVTQTSIAHLPKEKFEQVPLAVPSPEEQRVIAQILTDMDTEITAIETRRTKTQALKQGMMQELLTGRTRLK
jgi:type I restriction enzyme, S subunit